MAADEPELPAPDAGAAEGPRPRRRGRLLILALLAAAAAASPWWGPRALAHLAYFRVRRVEVQGARYIAAGDILRRLAVDTLASVWAPTEPLARRVETIIGIRDATVRRRLPGTLVVIVDESPPVALVPAADGFRAYDDRGFALPIDLTRVPVDAPIARQRDSTLLALLGEVRRESPELFRRLEEVRRQGRDEVVLRIDSLIVRAMLDVTPARLLDLEPVERDLGRRRARVAELDLRFRDQVIARLQ